MDFHPSDTVERRLDAAVLANDVCTVKQLLPLIWNPGRRAWNEGVCPLHVAADKGFEDIVDLLLLHGFNANSTGGYLERAPLHFAAKRGHVGIVLSLKANGAKVDQRDRMNRTPLHEAADSMMIVALLLRENSIDMQDLWGDTALHCAVREGHTMAFFSLLDGGASIDVKNKDLRTPLHEAAIHGRMIAICQLLNSGSDIHAKDSLGQTALHKAVQFGKTEAVRFLLIKGARAKDRDVDGATAMHYAVRYGHEKIIEELVTKEGNNLLHWAVYFGQVGALKKLLEGGAEVKIENEEGETPLEMARIHGQVEAIQVLEKHEEIQKAKEVQKKYEEIKLDDEEIRLYEKRKGDWREELLCCLCIDVAVQQSFKCHGGHVVCAECEALLRRRDENVCPMCGEDFEPLAKSLVAVRTIMRER